MTDIVLDTNILADLLSQFYKTDFRYKYSFNIYRSMNKGIVRQINKIIN